MPPWGGSQTPARGRQKANLLGHGFIDQMSLDALAQSLRRWKEDCESVELKRYAKREWGAETGFFYLSSGPKRQSTVGSAAAALFRKVRSYLSISRTKSVNENKLPAGKASINRSVQSPETLGFGIPTEDISTELADPLIIGLGQRNRRTAAETASTVVFRKSENDEHH